MDDELEKLLHELAGQERERLRRKYAKPVPMTTSHHNNRCQINTDVKKNRLLSRSFQHETSYLKTSVSEHYSQKKTANDAMCQMYPNMMTHFPFPGQSDNNQNSGHDYLSKRELNYEFSTLSNRPERGFQLFSKYSQPDIFPRNAQFSQDLSFHTSNDIAYESNFARNLLYKVNDADIPLSNMRNGFR
jgi:hypothetical protein